MNQSSKNTLGLLLKDSGVTQTVQSISGIIKGVAAGPSHDGVIGDTNAWIQLIGPNIPEILVNTLKLEVSSAIKVDDGLSTNTQPNTYIKRLTELRQELKVLNINGFIVPLADEHQGEYVPKHSQRLSWLTGFTGSAGMAIVLEKKAAIFVDGRYTLQAREQVNSEFFEINHLIDNPADLWITEMLSTGSILGFDPWLHTGDGVAQLKNTCLKIGVNLMPVPKNPIDTVWINQPPPPITPVILLDKNLTGETSTNKRFKICEQLKKEKIDACILTAPDSIAWLTNTRGGDVPYTPFSLGFAVLYVDSSLEIYNDPRKFTPKIQEQLEGGIHILDRANFLATLKRLGKKKYRVGIDLSTAAEIISNTLKNAGAHLKRLPDPCILPKAKKNAVEVNGMRQAHLRDGVALTKFLAWLDENSPNGYLTEISVSDQLEKYRREGEKIQGLSFPTISGFGPNGAIVHYRATPQSNRKLNQNSLYLVDSGAQYLDGTTDVTRTVAIGTPSIEMKDRFPRVLKGHIALASAVFPEGTSGSQLDILARAPLWQVGLDYDHGTGHGVGSYLSVHEGPQRISKIPNRVALEPGMIISNEPGYYKTDEYGIRIENLVVVVPASSSNSHLDTNERPLLRFETLTLAPIDLSLVDKNILNLEEIKWINNYHQMVKGALSPLLDSKTQEWLQLITTDLTNGEN
jgi:Xaa-Pro aminopeptidase